MTGLAGFDFQALNRKYIAAPSNDATRYGVQIGRSKAMFVWRCIGVYHLAPNENNRRHNVFIECLDEHGNRVNDVVINWTWADGAPPQVKRLDKPANEPAADIPIDKDVSITLWVKDRIESDRVGNLHARHPDEGTQNTLFHQSFYVVFQRYGAMPDDPPVIVDTEPPTTPLTLESLAAQVAELKRRLDAMEGD